MILWRMSRWNFCNLNFLQFLLFTLHHRMGHVLIFYTSLPFLEYLNVRNIYLFILCIHLTWWLICPKSPGICRHFRYSSSSLPILQKPICSFPLGTWVPKIGETSGKPIAMLRPNASLSAALSLLIQGTISFTWHIYFHLLLGLEDLYWG